MQLGPFHLLIRFLKLLKDIALFISAGKLFHILAPSYRKFRPNLDVLTLGCTRRLLSRRLMFMYFLVYTSFIIVGPMLFVSLYISAAIDRSLVMYSRDYRIIDNFPIHRRSGDSKAVYIWTHQHQGNPISVGGPLFWYWTYSRTLPAFFVGTFLQ